MVVRLRLQRWGRLHSPFYRVAIADSRRHVSKKVVEYVGTYNPLVDRHGLKQLRLNIPRVKYWLAVGAQPSYPLRRLLASFNLLPLPPHRSTEPAHVGIIRGMTGQGGVDEVKGKEEGEPVRQVRTDWVYPSSKGIPFEQVLQVGQSQKVKDETQTKGEETGEAKPNPLQRFPFGITPTPATLSAWQMAQQRHNRVSSTIPPPTS